MIIIPCEFHMIPLKTNNYYYMKTKDNYLEEIKEIRKLMEESSRFLTLSGLSGILVGIYALAGAFLAYKLLNSPNYNEIIATDLVNQLVGIAVLTLLLSLVTIVWLTHRRVRQAEKKFWNAGSKLMMVNLAIPILSGGVLIIIFVSRGIYAIVSPACLIFYGLALINAAKFTRQEIFYMGLFQIVLGLLAALFSGFGLLLWALGFGAIHIIYGTVMYLRYEHQTND